MAADTAKILQCAADSFSTVRQIVEAAKGTMPPSAQRAMEHAVKDSGERARVHLNGKAARAYTMPEEECKSIIHLTDELDKIEEIEGGAENARPEEEEEEQSEDG